MKRKELTETFIVIWKKTFGVQGFIQIFQRFKGQKHVHVEFQLHSGLLEYV